MYKLHNKVINRTFLVMKPTIGYTLMVSNF